MQNLTQKQFRPLMAGIFEEFGRGLDDFAEIHEWFGGVLSFVRKNERYKVFTQAHDYGIHNSYRKRTIPSRRFKETKNEIFYIL